MQQLAIEPVIPSRSADVTLQYVGQEAILYDRRHGRAHVINSTAARIWELCDGQATLDDIAGRVAAAYGLPLAAVQDDVANMITTFAKVGVVR